MHHSLSKCSTHSSSSVNCLICSMYFLSFICGGRSRILSVPYRSWSLALRNTGYVFHQDGLRFTLCMNYTCMYVVKKGCGRLPVAGKISKVKSCPNNKIALVEVKRHFDKLYTKEGQKKLLKSVSPVQSIFVSAGMVPCLWSTTCRGAGWSFYLHGSIQRMCISPYLTQWQYPASAFKFRLRILRW